jgi:hypothetical protein
VDDGLGLLLREGAAQTVAVEEVGLDELRARDDRPAVALREVVVDEDLVPAPQKLLRHDAPDVPCPARDQNAHGCEPPGNLSRLNFPPMVAQGKDEG